MKEYLKKKSIGFYLTAIAAILALVGLIIYTGSINKTSSVIVVLIIAIVCFVAVAVLTKFIGDETYFNISAIVFGVLTAIAFIAGIAPQIDQIGYCIAGLDSWGILSTYIISAVCVFIAIVLNVVAGFTGIIKDAE